MPTASGGPRPPSDRGSQYVSLAFGERCREAGIDLSMTEGGSPLDNAVAESFFATLKKETAHGARDNARRRAVYAERREAA